MFFNKTLYIFIDRSTFSTANFFYTSSYHFSLIQKELFIQQDN